MRLPSCPVNGGNVPTNYNLRTYLRTYLSFCRRADRSRILLSLLVEVGAVYRDLATAPRWQEIKSAWPVEREAISSGKVSAPPCPVPSWLVINAISCLFQDVHA